MNVDSCAMPFILHKARRGRGDHWIVRLNVRQRAAVCRSALLIYFKLPTSNFLRLRGWVRRRSRRVGGRDWVGSGGSASSDGTAGRAGDGTCSQCLGIEGRASTG